MQNRKNALRFSLVFSAFLALLAVFVFKLVLIQIFRSDYLVSLANRQHNHVIELESERGNIYDRNLRPLAYNVPVYSLYANPRLMTDDAKKLALEKLPSLINTSASQLKERFEKDKFFVWLERKLDINQVNQIKALKIKGLDFIKESKRLYPNGSLAAHIIGFAGVDHQGLEGLELYYDDKLKGQNGKAVILRDARQRDLIMEQTLLEPKNGYHLVLTIDETIQYIAEKALDKAFLKHNAIAASIIVMNVKTGEILALANRPTYDLQNVSKSDVASRTNRALNFVYEPGSVFKIVAAAAALEEGVWKESDIIFCENGEYRVGNHILHDHTPHGKLTFAEVFQYSSNIGVTKVAQKLGAQKLYEYAKRFRFDEKTGVDLLGEVKGVVKPPSQWSKTTIGAFSIGHEVTVTPFQLLYALGAIANDGLYVKPYVVKSINDSQGEVIKSYYPEIVERVISSDTAHRVTDILVNVVEKGTAKLAQIKGIKVAGKTGTAQKVVNGEYSHSKFYATFMGFAPADDPKLAAIVVFDEPHPSHFGGTVSAPVFQEVISNALKYLGVNNELTPMPYDTVNIND